MEKNKKITLKYLLSASTVTIIRRDFIFIFKHCTNLLNASFLIHYVKRTLLSIDVFCTRGQLYPLPLPQSIKFPTTISINYVKSSLPPPPPPPHMPGGGMSLIDTLLNDNSFIVLMNHQIFFPILTLKEMLVLGVNLHKELLGFPSYGHLRLQIDF